MNPSRRLEVFAVEPDAVQLSWGRLGPGDIAVQARPVSDGATDASIVVEADGGPGAVDLIGLTPDTDYVITVGSRRLTTRTAPHPAGPELYRFMTLVRHAPGPGPFRPAQHHARKGRRRGAVHAALHPGGVGRRHGVGGQAPDHQGRPGRPGRSRRVRPGGQGVGRGRAPHRGHPRQPRGQAVPRRRTRRRLPPPGPAPAGRRPPGGGRPGAAAGAGRLDGPGQQPPPPRPRRPPPGRRAGRPPGDGGRAPPHAAAAVLDHVASRGARPDGEPLPRRRGGRRPGRTRGERPHPSPPPSPPRSPGHRRDRLAEGLPRYLDRLRRPRGRAPSGHPPGRPP